MTQAKDASIHFISSLFSLTRTAFTSHTDTFSITMWTREEKEEKKGEGKRKKNHCVPVDEVRKGNFSTNSSFLLSTHCIVSKRHKVSSSMNVRPLSWWRNRCHRHLETLLLHHRYPSYVYHTDAQISLSLSLSARGNLHTHTHNTRTHSETFVKWNKWSKTGASGWWDSWLKKRLHRFPTISQHETIEARLLLLITSSHCWGTHRLRARERDREGREEQHWATVTFEPVAVSSTSLSPSFLLSLPFTRAIHSSLCNLITIEESRTRGDLLTRARAK